MSEFKPLGCSHDNLASNYNNTASLRVPIAEAESDFETLDDDDDGDEKNDEEEEEENHSQVNIILFYS